VAYLDGSPRAAATRAADLLEVLRPDAPAPEPADVIGVLRRHGEPEPISLTAGDITELRSAASLLWAVFAAASTEEAAHALNAILHSHAYPPRLSSHDRTPWHIHVDRHDDASWAEWFASSSAMALAVLLAERQANPAGLCASPSCGRPFIDHDQGDPRRYCSPRCASRERVAAHRERNRAQR
jgi:predicted RNA-binding Zn ribbon-like protein